MAGGGFAAADGRVHDYGGGRVTLSVVVTCLVAASCGLIFGYDIGVSGAYACIYVITYYPLFAFSACLVAWYMDMRHFLCFTSSVRLGAAGRAVRSHSIAGIFGLEISCTSHRIQFSMRSKAWFGIRDFFFFCDFCVS